LVAENRILRSQIDGRVQLTDSERKELAEIGAKLGKQVLAEIAEVALAEVRTPRSQERGKVVVFLPARLQQIRDGPRSSRHRLDGWLETDQREAA
jgi:hypothetical protein